MGSEISPEEMGFCLQHEHIMTDFISAEQTGKHRYEWDEVISVMLHYLKEIKELGVDTFIECTPKYVGRDVGLLKKCEVLLGLHILTNTGQYARQKLLPPETYDLPADALATWIEEFRKGMDGTGITSGFIKTAVEEGK